MASGAKAIYPDMKLYEEILFLRGYFNGEWCVENVKSWYEPLIKPQLLQRHYFWMSREIPKKEFKKTGIKLGNKKRLQYMIVDELQEKLEIELPEGVKNKRTLLRNCVNPEVGKYILDEMMKPKPKQEKIKI